MNERAIGRLLHRAAIPSDRSEQRRRGRKLFARDLPIPLLPPLLGPPEDKTTQEWLPRYLYESSDDTVRVSTPFYWLLFLVQKIAELLIRIALRPRSGDIGTLDRDEVDAVYSARAENYDFTHHIGTRGQDTQWRRLAGEIAVELLRSSSSKSIRILDLCTGTGLTPLEIDSVVAANRMSHNYTVEILGIDLNTKMLQLARKRERSFKCSSARFFTADAAALVSCSSDTSEKASRLAQFPATSFDLVTQIFGIGGIKNPLAVFSNALQLLVDRGRYLLVDIHRPIPALAGEIAVGTWFRPTAVLEAFLFKRTTVPLVLNRLWAWREATLDFYIAPLVTFAKDGKWWGFEILLRHYEPERWWAALPVMPTMRLLLQKVAISEEEGQRREKMLESVLLSVS